MSETASSFGHMHLHCASTSNYTEKAQIPSCFTTTLFIHFIYCLNKYCSYTYNEPTHREGVQ